MIENEQQYRITRSWVERFRREIAEFDDSPRAGEHPRLVAACRAALESHLSRLLAEIEEYERVGAGSLAVGRGGFAGGAG